MWWYLENFDNKFQVNYYRKTGVKLSPKKKLAKLTHLSVVYHDSGECTVVRPVRCSQPQLPSSPPSHDALQVLPGVPHHPGGDGQLCCRHPAAAVGSGTGVVVVGAAADYCKTMWG